jgi:hypothetical protein
VSRYAFTSITTPRLLLFLAVFLLEATVALATDIYQYGADEYVTIAQGISPGGKYAITAHGEGEYGYDNFHIFLTEAVSGKKIGPLQEIRETLDTGAAAFCAKWSKDSRQVTIVYRVDRHAPLKAVSYDVSNGRARPIKGPFDVTNNELLSYWQKQCSESKPSEKIFGTSRAH